MFLLREIPTQPLPLRSHRLYGTLLPHPQVLLLRCDASLNAGENAPFAGHRLLPCRDSFPHVLDGLLLSAGLFVAGLCGLDVCNLPLCGQLLAGVPSLHLGLIVRLLHPSLTNLVHLFDGLGLPFKLVRDLLVSLQPFLFDPLRFLERLERVVPLDQLAFRRVCLTVGENPA